MVEEGEKKKGKKKKDEAKQEQDYQDFLDDVEGDKELQKEIKMYKNTDRLKHMSKQELDKEIEDMELVGLLEDMNINAAEKEEKQPNKEEA